MAGVRLDREVSERAALPARTQVLVVGSGAGGATTAVVLAESGFDVLVLEEGPDLDTRRLASNSPAAVSQLYRNGGLTPMFGGQSVAFVEGRCVGGSTEINSGFWHRLPMDCHDRWKADVLLDDFEPELLAGYFDRIESDLSVSHLGEQRESKGSALFRRGAERLDWECREVPRCQQDPSASQFSPGAKQSMQRTYLPRAAQAGARILAGWRVRRVLVEGGRAVGVLAASGTGADRVEQEIRADSVFLCCGVVQTPALLRRSRIRKNVGNSLSIHPMIKAAALFDEEVDGFDPAIPMYQVREFGPAVTLGGSVFTPGFLAMLLADDWDAHGEVMRECSRMALYYAATRGLSRGKVRALPGHDDNVLIRYPIGPADRQNLSVGLGRLGELLFAAGARAVYPSLRGFGVLRSADQCRGLAENGIPVSAMSLSTVHAFSTCPMGENPDVCATDSFGRVRDVKHLTLSDASVIPDSPGVNPQGTTMAIAMRNAERFIERESRTRRSPRTAGAKPDMLITGATGWLGSRLMEWLEQSEEAAERWPRIRCLVPRRVDPSPLLAVSERVEVVEGDLTDPPSLDAFARGAEGATLFHIAGLIHPNRVAEFQRVNVEGTASLLTAARNAGVRRVVAMSSNSPLGCNPDPDHCFDESSPYAPYMGYGRSKQRMEELVQQAQESGTIETVTVRAPWFYGPHQPARQIQFFRMIRAGRFPILGDGNQKRSMAYVDNLCQGLELAATAPGASGETYWIADARPYSINEIVNTIVEVLEGEFELACARRRLRAPSLVGDVAEWVDRGLQSAGLYEQRIHVLGEMNKTIACSIEKARVELGYTPRVELREGMIESLRWCFDNGFRV